MNLIIFNGSPRRKKSNSKILMDQFLSGFNQVHHRDVPIYYLASTKKIQEFVAAFSKADTIILICPLYTDCMPGIVKYFLESIYELKGLGSKEIGFIVQSGFPEAHHSVYLERYLRKWTARMQYHYLGTVIRGGVEGIQIQPPSWTRKLFKAFFNLGTQFAITGAFDPAIVEALKHPYTLSAGRRFLYRLMAFAGLTNYYWNMKLKEHHAYEKRFDRPYSAL